MPKFVVKSPQIPLKRQNADLPLVLPGAGCTFKISVTGTLLFVSKPVGIVSVRVNRGKDV